MKTSIYLLAVIGTILFLTSCAKDVEDVNFVPEVKISFQGGGDSNIVKVEKGVNQYTAKIDVQSSGSIISIFEIYTADAKTGNRDTLITETAKSFDGGQANYSATYTIPELSENRCIKVVVTDTLGRVYEKNLVVNITPSVVFANAAKIETVENFYGPYYATWLSGRVYMRKHTDYKNEIDFSLGDVVIASEGATAVPALINPAQRSATGLLTTEGLQSAKFDSTTLTVAQYNGISQVNAGAITSLPDPTHHVVRIKAGRVYLFKTANGKKGLIHVSALAQKTGTIENTNGEWIAQTNYYEATISSKTVLP